MIESVTFRPVASVFGRFDGATLQRARGRHVGLFVFSICSQAEGDAHGDVAQKPRHMTLSNTAVHAEIARRNAGVLKETCSGYPFL